MSDIHIEEFYHDIAKVFLSLYLNFPRLTTVYVEDISGPDTADEYGLHSERHLSCFAAMLWLQKHDHIYFNDTIRQEAIDQASLTQQCFLTLSSRAEVYIESDVDSLSNLPDSIAQEQISNIHTLRKIVRHGSATKLSEIVRNILENSQHSNGKCSG